MRRILAAIILGIFSVSTQGATVLYDTLSQPRSIYETLSYNVGMSANLHFPPRSTAMRFVPSEGSFLSSIEVNLLEFNREPWSLSASIYSDVGGRPGQTALESILFSEGTPGFRGDLSLVASGATWLDPTQAYWLGLAPETEGMHIGWVESGLAGYGRTKAQTFAALNGFWFNILTSENQAAFRISGSQAVPEPGTLSLLLIGFFCSALMRFLKMA